MKLVLTHLLVLIASFSFGQELTLQLSKYPRQIADVMQDYKGITGEQLEIAIDNNKWVTKQKAGSFGYLSKYSSGSSTKSLWLHAIYKDGDREKGVIVIQSKGEKKYGGFKVKTSGYSRNTGLAFTINGKYLVALGIEDGTLFAYQYNIATKKLELKGLPIDMNKMPNNIYAVGSAGNGNHIYATDNDNGVIIIDLKNKKGKYYNDIANGKNYKYLFPSQISNHFLIGNNDYYLLCDGTNGEVLFTEKRAIGSILPESFYITTDGKELHKINDIDLTGDGVGMVATKNSLIIFDQKFNYFTLTETGQTVDVFDFLQVKGNSDILEPQPDPIPIISDNLTTAGIKFFFEQTANICKKDNNRKLAFQVFESAEPFSDELVGELSKSSEQYVVEFVGKHVAQWINATAKLTLAETGKDSNIKRKNFIDKYNHYSKSLSQDEYGKYLADKTEVQNALIKLQPLTVDLYYMSVDELIAKGNKAVKTGASLSPTAALLGVKFYEVAAEKEPNEPVHQILIANAYANANKYPEALQYYNKALAMKPEYPLALFGIMKTSFMPVQKGQKSLDDNLAKSIIENANRFLAVAPDDYIPEMNTAKRYKAFCQLYIDNKTLYTQYNQATGLQNVETRSSAVAGLLLPVEKTGNKYLAADMANIIAFDLIELAASKNSNGAEYLKADAMFAKSVNGGVYDAKTYYEWASINIHNLKRNDEALQIIEEAKKHYPTDANFDVLANNLYYNKGRELYLAKSYGKAIPYFEKYASTATKPIAKVYDYLGFSYYRVKKYPKAAENLRKLKSMENSNTLQAFYPNFNAVLSYAENPSGTAPIPKDNGDKIEAVEAKYEKGIGMGGSEGLKLMEEAASYFDQIDYDHGQAVAHSGVGVAYHRAGNKSVAKSHYIKCIDNGATSSSCYNNLAMIYLDNKQYAECIGVIGQGQLRFPKAENLKRTKADYFYSLGVKKLNDKLYHVAVGYFEKSVQNYDKDAWAWLWLGYARYYNKDTYGAKAAFKKADQLDPSLRKTEHGESIKAILGY